MYTIDDQNEESLYEDGGYESSNWESRRGLLFKIIIIILCVIVLIWLINALKSNNYSDNGQIHIENTEKIRLAAEDYFFLKNNKSKSNYISLSGLKKEGLISDIVDANNKVCSDSGTGVNLDNDYDTYKMTVKFSCSTKDKDEVFYYHKNTLACLNCSGNTHMKGKTVVINDNGDNDNKKADIEEPEYSCVEWSPWSKNRVNDPYLIEKTSVMVTGVKYGNRKEYGDWSEYTTSPITSATGLEVETKTVTENVWSKPKTGSGININSPSIKVLSSQKVSGSGGCNGHMENNVCYSNKVTTGNLTYKEFISGDYNVKKENCKGVKTIKDKNGLNVLTFIDCEYNIKVEIPKSNTTYTVYTYQELEVKSITYYRSRTVKEINEPNEYTYTKVEEKDLPEGFVKLEGSEETFYSYKLATCEK